MDTLLTAVILSFAATISDTMWLPFMYLLSASYSFKAWTIVESRKIDKRYPVGYTMLDVYTALAAFIMTVDIVSVFWSIQMDNVVNGIAYVILLTTCYVAMYYHKIYTVVSDL